ncbi:MAG: DUF4974 domain-containing protein [Saprospiraceae bacterium]|nr:DUF4974 domain-containing protein [Saprospiraceae bacterium]
MDDKYLSYEPDDLTVDESFLRYASQPNTEEADQWNAWIEKNPSMKEKVASAQQLLSALEFRTIKTEGAAERIWDRIDKSVTEEPTHQVRHRKIRPLHIIGAVAAGLALLIAFRLVYPDTSIIESPYGQSLTVNLPDASTVQLNDGSRLSYDPGQFLDGRTLNLRGEAFFEVQKGASFQVHTIQGVVTVLGTSFNVFSRSDRFIVHCHTGSVRVEHQSSSVVLKPGEMSMLDQKGALNVDNFDPIGTKDWRSGVFNYENVPLQQVFAEIERQFEVKIKTSEAIYQQTYSGFFNEESLEDALHSVCWPLKLNTEINKNQVRISK